MESQPRTGPTRRGVARGGRSLYGAPLGILVLEARFPRIPGDIGNAATWPFPVLYKVVRGATPERVVLDGARGLLPDFLDGAAELVRLGAEAITTRPPSRPPISPPPACRPTSRWPGRRTAGSSSAC